MEENSISPIAFPLDLMNQSALEHMALSPYRFSCLLNQSLEDTLRPTSIRAILPYLNEKQLAKLNITSSGNCYDIVLLPGGRFLVTISKGSAPFTPTHVSCIQLWDIGLPGHGHQNKLLATAVINPPSEPVAMNSLLATTRDGNTFNLISRSVSR